MFSIGAWISNADFEYVTPSKFRPEGHSGRPEKRLINWGRIGEGNIKEII